MARPPPVRTRLRRGARALLLRALIAALTLLPIRAARALGRAGGRLACLLARRERSRAEAHLRVAFPEAEEAFITATARRCFANLGEHALELCVAHRIDRNIRRHVIVEPGDLDDLDEALHAGRGCLVVGGHIGSWELAARALVERGYEVVAVARNFKDRGLGGIVHRMRVGGGVVTLPRGASGTVRKILAQIRNGGSLFMLVDQDTSVPSVFVPFFGKAAKTPRGHADLALRTGAPIVMGFIHRDGPGGSHRLRAERLTMPPLSGDRQRDVEAVCAAVNARLEEEIRAFPADWVWFHERWRSVPEASSENIAGDSRRDAARSDVQVSIDHSL